MLVNAVQRTWSNKTTLLKGFRFANKPEKVFYTLVLFKMALNEIARCKVHKV